MSTAEHTGCLGCGHSCGKHSCVSRVPMFHALPPPLLDQVAAALVRWDADARTPLFHAGDPIRGIYIIRYGSVKLVRWDEEGDEHILGILRAGDFYGGNNLFHDSRAQETALCMEKTGICLLPETGLRDLLMREPEIAVQVIRWYSAMHERNLNMLEILSLKDIGKRVKRFLLWQAEDLITLSQEEIARMIAVTPETLNRKLAELKRQGIVRMEGHRSIRVVKRELLGEEA